MDLYFETYSGIAGNMTIGALLDLGADKNALIDALNSMDFGDYELNFEKVKKNGIDALSFDVILPHHHEEDHHHEHHEHHEHHHHHEHRHLSNIFEIIDSGNLSDKVKHDSKEIFKIIAKAESIAHGVAVEEVHFHEVGAVDSIIDIVGTCVLLENLNAENIYFTDLYEGRGFVKCAHGAMPVPVPAVINILAAENIPLNIIDDEGEHVTPTGAAIVAYFSQGKPDFTMNIKKVGLGAGTREFKNTTNILRVMEIENSKKKQFK